MHAEGREKVPLARMFFYSFGVLFLGAIADITRVDRAIYLRRRPLSWTPGDIFPRIICIPWIYVGLTGICRLRQKIYENTKKDSRRNHAVNLLGLTRVVGK